MNCDVRVNGALYYHHSRLRTFVPILSVRVPLQYIYILLDFDSSGSPTWDGRNGVTVVCRNRATSRTFRCVRVASRPVTVSRRRPHPGHQHKSKFAFLGSTPRPFHSQFIGQSVFSKFREMFISSTFSQQGAPNPRCSYVVLHHGEERVLIPLQKDVSVHYEVRIYTCYSRSRRSSKEKCIRIGRRALCEGGVEFGRRRAGFRNKGTERLPGGSCWASSRVFCGRYTE